MQVKMIKTGVTKEMKKQFADIFVKLGKGEIVEDAVAKVEEKSDNNQEFVKPKRKYKRKDMVAES